MTETNERVFSLKAAAVLAATVLLAAGLAVTAVPQNAWADSSSSADTSWYDSTSTEFELSTASQLAGVATLVNGGTETFAGKTITLTADIDLSTVCGPDADKGSWVPIGSSSNPFQGSFDGDSHEIKGLYMEVDCVTSNTHYALFGDVKGTVAISNLELNDVSVSVSVSGSAKNAYAAGLIGVAATGTNLTIENVSVDGSIVGIGSTGAYAAAFMADTRGTLVMKSCVASGSVTAQADTKVYAGGLVGNRTLTASTFENCANKATISAISASEGSAYAGGLIGYVSVNNSLAGALYSCVANDSYNVGSVSSSAGAANYAGGLYGYVVCKVRYAGSVEASASGCFNAGSVTGGADQTGAIIGCVDKQTTATGALSTVSSQDTYYVSASCPSIGDIIGDGTGDTVTDNSVEKTADFMKSAEFVSLLNGEKTTWVADAAGINGGYPILAFEASSEPAPAGPAVSLSTEATGIKMGDTFTVDVSMTAITAAAQGTLTWSDNLQLVKIEKGAALTGDDCSFENVAGNGLFSFVANEGAADGIVAVATFKCVGMGEATVGMAEGGVAGKSVESMEYELAVPEALELEIGLPGILGDANNNGKVNIVDAQIVYDLGAGKYAANESAMAALLACWYEGATVATVNLVADVNADEDVDSSDAFAIQYYVHNGAFGPVTD